MARGILVTYPGYPYAMNSLMPDNGLANLAGALFAAGHEARVIDYGTVEMIRRLFPESIAAALRRDGHRPDLRLLDRELEKNAAVVLAEIARELCDQVREFGADFVGFKLWNGDGCFGSIELARALRREFPRLTILGGGPHVLFAIQPVIAETGRFAPLDDGTFDVLIQSEAEDLMGALVDLSQGKVAPSAIPNAIYRDGETLRINPIERVQSLDALAPPRYDASAYPSMEGDAKLRIITLDESRGCPYHCHFCIQPAIIGHKVRLRAATSVVDEMLRCVREYQVSAFRFAGSATPGKLMTAITDEVQARRARVHFTAFGRVNHAQPEAFARNRQSGLLSLFFGVESGSQAMLDRMNKLVNVAEMRRVLLESKRAGIFTVASLISPLPGETDETWQETLALLEEVRPDSVLISPPGPVPGTAWWNESEKFGIHLSEGFAERLLGFKFKTLFPPDQWEWPEYSVDGKDVRAILRECGQKIQQVERMGLLTMFCDDMVLMCHYSSLSPCDFRDRTQAWLNVGDWESIAATVAEMNAGIRAEARSNAAA